MKRLMLFPVFALAAAFAFVFPAGAQQIKGDVRVLNGFPTGRASDLPGRRRPDPTGPGGGPEVRGGGRWEGGGVCGSGGGARAGTAGSGRHPQAALTGSRRAGDREANRLDPREPAYVCFKIESANFPDPKTSLVGLAALPSHSLALLKGRKNQTH